MGACSNKYTLIEICPPACFLI